VRDNQLSFHSFTLSAIHHQIWNSFHKVTTAFLVLGFKGDMMRVFSFTLIAFFAFFEVVICGDNIHGSPWSRRHNSNIDVGVAQRNTALEKRFDGARFTYYAAGLGACGKVNIASDFIVALNAPQFEGGAHCFQTITITVNGKSTQAQIMDRCAGCDYGGLDFSSGLFDFFGSESLGVLTGSWVFGDGAVSSSTTSTSWTSTSQPPPSSTSSVTHYTTSNSTTSTQTPTPTSTTQSSASISATPTPSQETGNIADLYLIIIEFGSILVVGHDN
jgi:hypothetical protein